MDDWEDIYDGRWIVIDLTNVEDGFLEGAVFYGPFETRHEASDWGNTNCSLSIVSALEDQTGEMYP